MKFIHFIDSNLIEKVLDEGLFLRPNYREVNEESSGIFCYPLINIPFKTPTLEGEYDYLIFKQEEDQLNESLSIEESWEFIGVSRVTRRDPEVKKVSGVIFEIEKKHWPLTVFINIGHKIGYKFAQVLEKNPVKGIYYGDENNLLKVIRKIESKRYVIVNAPFRVDTEVDLLDLIIKFKSAGGGIWKEDSFECMLTANISRENIEKIIEFNKAH